MTVRAVPDLPLSVDGITASWLTRALRAGGDQEVTVRDLAVTNVVWGTATKVLLRVDYASGGSCHPERLCVKGGFVPELRAIMAEGYRTEARFYREIAPQLDKGLPRCWFAGENGEQGIVVLDDLVAEGARFRDAREPLTVDQAAAALDVLASWHRRRDITVPWQTAVPHLRAMVQGLLTPAHWDTHIGQTVEGPVLDVLDDRERVARAFGALWATEDARPRALIHGDANLTNVYLDAAGAPRFLDWQFAGLADAYHDVALFLIGALSVEDRRTHERPLLRAYLAGRGDTAETFDEAWTAYRRHPLHGAVYALTPEQMQPAAIRAALAERFAQAALDLDTLRLLGA